MNLPQYWQEACDELLKVDKILGTVIVKHRHCLPKFYETGYVALMQSIVSQQIHTRLAKQIWEQLALCCQQQIVPENVLRIDEQTLLQMGLSLRKCQYIYDITQAYVNGGLCDDTWSSMADEEVIDCLCQLRGVGPWTAKMFLMLYLQRPNVLPLEDFGIRKAIERLYFVDQVPSLQDMRVLGQRWAPWSSVATWYLWKSIES